MENDKLMRNCLKCGGSYYDDGNTLCPDCDVSTAYRANLDPIKVRAYRDAEQAKLKLAQSTKWHCTWCPWTQSFEPPANDHTCPDCDEGHLEQ